MARELLKLRSWSPSHPEIFHFRDHGGTEVDFMLAAPGGKSLVGIEEKASATIGPSDTKGLKVLSAVLKRGFVKG